MGNQSMTSVDFGPIIVQVVLPLVTALAGVLATWLAAKLAKWLNLRNEGVLRDTLNVAISHGLALAQSRLVEAANAGNLSLEVKNQLVARAAQYALAHEPEAAKALGYDPNILAEKIRAQLEINTVPAAQSAAVPTP